MQEVSNEAEETCGPVEPVLGIAVGAIGLGAIAFWVFRRRV